MLMHRLLPPADGRAQTVFIDGRVYSSKPSRYVDAPAEDALELVSAGWGLVGPVGSTQDRPCLREAFAGMAYLDLDLGRVVVFDGRAWRDPLSGEAV